MPERISIPPPSEDEEMRQLAQVVADIHYVLSIIIEHATEFVPGEAVDELTAAWNISGQSLQQLVTDLYPTPPSAPAWPPLFQEIAKAELAGEVGQIKKSTFNRLRDRFFSYWFSEPRTEEKRTKAAEAAEALTEIAATVISSIPGREHVVEILSLTRQLIGVRLERGY